MKGKTHCLPNAGPDSTRQLELSLPAFATVVVVDVVVVVVVDAGVVVDAVVVVEAAVVVEGVVVVEVLFSAPGHDDGQYP